MKKESIHIAHEKSTWLVTIFLPVLLIILFGFGINLDPAHLKLGVLLPNNNQSLYQQFSPLINAHAFEHIESGTLDTFILQIEHNQLRSFLSFDSNAQLLITDGTDPNTANIFSGTIEGVLKSNKKQIALEKGSQVSSVSLVSRSWFNPDLKTSWALVPGSLAVIMTLVTTLLSSLVIAKEYELGVVESLYTTPLKPVELYIAKSIVYFGLSSLVMLGSILFCVLLYQLPIKGSWFFLIISTVCFLYCNLNMGLAISISFKDQFFCSQIALMSAYMPSFMLSGFLFELSSMPTPIQWISHCVAARYFVPCLQVFFLGGGHLFFVLKQCVFLVALGSFWLYVSCRQMNRRIAS